MDEKKTKTAPELYTSLFKNAMEEWDWNLAGGAWPIELETLEELTEDEANIERLVETGVEHYIHKPPRWSWRRVYDDDGNFDYELSEWYSKNS